MSDARYLDALTGLSMDHLVQLAIAVRNHCATVAMLNHRHAPEILSQAVGSVDVEAIIQRQNECGWFPLSPPAPTQAESYDAPTGRRRDDAMRLAERVYCQFVGPDRSPTDVSILTGIVERHLLQPPGTTTPDVQAQACSHCGAPDTRLRCEWGTGCSPMITEVSDVQAQIDAAVADCERRCATQLADHISRAADDERVRIDAAVAAERERQCVDAAAFRLLREEADAADAWHADTGMKVARPPRMSPATVKHIRDAEIRACSGAQGELRCS